MNSLMWSEARMNMPQDLAPADKLIHSMHDLTVICPISPEQPVGCVPKFYKVIFQNKHFVKNRTLILYDHQTST